MCTQRCCDNHQPDENRQTWTFVFWAPTMCQVLHYISLVYCFTQKCKTPWSQGPCLIHIVEWDNRMTKEITGYLVKIKIGIPEMEPWQRWQWSESDRKSRQERKALRVCTALSCCFFSKPKSTNLPFTHTLGGYEQNTNMNIGDHFLLVCLYLCTKGEIYLSQALTRAWFQALM